MPDRHPKDVYVKRMGALDNEYQSFEPHYKELIDHVLPRRGRFFIGERNKGQKKHNNIINSEATWALRVARSGMMAGTMSPARPWFALETHDPDLLERQEVKEWLFKVEHLIRTVLHSSNFYGQVPLVISELLLVGTGCMTHVDDFEDVARFYDHTVGSYRIASNDRGEVDTVYRKFEWPALRIVTQFGKENVSRQVEEACDRGNYDTWFPVWHIIEPNDQFRTQSPLARNKAFKSVYMEPDTASGHHKDRWLSISGFDEFPAYCPRWSITGEDVYGTDCPGMDALGDIKQLQHEEKRKAQGIDKQMSPPLHGPPSLNNVPVSSLPGGLTIYEGQESRNVLAPIYEVTPNLQDLRHDMASVETRIGRAFFVDMFLAISQMEGIQPRNQLDLMHRNEERLLQLGPVLERLQSDFQDKLINRTYNQLDRAGVLPPPPGSLVGKELKVKYISTLAMAQRAVATQGIDRIVGFAGALAGAGWARALKKIDELQAVDEYAKAIGVPPSVIRPDDIVSGIEEQENAQAQVQQAAGLAQVAGSAAKDLAQANKTAQES